jgi:hypothetical protein
MFYERNQSGCIKHEANSDCIRCWTWWRLTKLNIFSHFSAIVFLQIERVSGMGSVNFKTFYERKNHHLDKSFLGLICSDRLEKAGSQLNDDSILKSNEKFFLPLQNSSLKTSITKFTYCKNFQKFILNWSEIL